MDKKAHIKGQLLGYKELPEQSGLWGVLLPRPGERKVAHEPDAQDVVQQLDDSCLVFENSMLVGNRGFGLSFGSYLVTAVSVSILPVFLIGMVTTKQELALWEFCIFGAVLLTVVGGPALWAYRSARNPLPPPVYLARKHRKVYVWQVQAKHWIALDYDGLVPVTFINHAVTTSGAFTSYVLTLCSLKLGTRKIEYAVMPAPAQSTPQECGALWEFIRRYMEESPQSLVPVRLVRSPTKANWMARADRDVLRGQVDDDHRVGKGLGTKFLVWFYVLLFYWPERARNWIERTAPRPVLPPELVVDLQTADANGYRTVELTAVESQAQAGTLSHMRRRWLVGGVVSTLIWGGVFALLTAGIWVRQ